MHLLLPRLFFDRLERRIQRLNVRRVLGRGSVLVGCARHGDESRGRPDRRAEFEESAQDVDADHGQKTLGMKLQAEHRPSLVLHGHDLLAPSGRSDQAVIS